MNTKLANISQAIARTASFMHNIPEGGVKVRGNPITGDHTEVVTMRKMQADECSLIHRFANGCYIREILMPQGSIVIGKVHKTEHFNVILEGAVTVITSEGAKFYKAPSTFVSKAGVQKVVIMHTECRWQTVHVTDETDIPTIENALVEEGFDELEAARLMEIAGDLI